MLDSASCGDDRLSKELKVTAPIGRGKSNGAQIVQELLALNGVSLVIDGDLGDATEKGIAKFCTAQGMPASKTVDQALMDRLAQPLLRAIQPVAPLAGLGQTVVAVAQQHLKEHPIEVDGQNSGPWVRLYMDGNQGDAYPWCAGFVTYVIRDAAKAHGVPTPIGRTYSCDVLGSGAKKAGKFKARPSGATAPPGSVFLVPHATNANDWIHTGIITETDGTTFDTIEGNTNDTGSREGFEVCARIRSCAKLDVVLL